MKYYIGIDGGGSKSDFVLCDEKAIILAEWTGPGCHYLQWGYQGLSSLIEEGISQVCKIAKINQDEIAYSFFGCAGYGDVKEDSIKIEEAAEKAFGNIPYAIANDCENAFTGALAGQDGINIIAGTGSIGFGRNKGQSKRCGGWHHAIGSDEGSAYWIGWSMLKSFTRQSDGRDEKTALYELLKRELELNDDGEIIKRVVEEWDLDRTKIAGLAKLIGQLCESKDPCALDIVERAAHELADIAIALNKELGFTGKTLVSGTGGVFNLGDKLIKPFAQKLEDGGLKYVTPQLSPKCGALILAMQSDGIEIREDVIEGLKKGYM
ncbi:MAG: ATPase [Clostridia bacterium]|nr:ATPase [Clostridia bacterium]